MRLVKSVALLLGGVIIGLAVRYFDGTSSNFGLIESKRQYSPPVNLAERATISEPDETKQHSLTKKSEWEQGLQRINLIRDSNERLRELQEFYRSFTDSCEPFEALQFLIDADINAARHLPLCELLCRMAREFPSETIDFLSNLDGRILDNQALEAFGSELSSAHPDIAFKMLTDGKTGNETAINIKRGILWKYSGGENIGISELVAISNQLSALPDRNIVITSGLKAERQFAKAAAFLKEISGDETLVVQLFTEWAEYAPNEVYENYTSVPVKYQARLLKFIFDQWSERDIKEAAQQVMTMEKGENREIALNAVVSHLKTLNPEEAVEFYNRATAP